MTNDHGRVRVAVIGGGCAAMSAAFELSKPSHNNRYDITVYQLGWRLGGKGASGRGPAGRIEEHGLHLWMGFYENAFRLMRDCYDELGRDREDCRIATWRDAFKPHPHVGISELSDGYPEDVWRLIVPVDDRDPGDPPGEYQRFTLIDYVIRIVNLVRALVQETDKVAAVSAAEAVSAKTLVDLVRKYTRIGETISLTVLSHLVSLLEPIARNVGRYPTAAVLKLLSIIGRSVHEQLNVVAQGDRTAGHVWTLVDLTLATVRGIVKHGLLTDPRGLDPISEFDCREWLRLNGAAEESVNSGYIRAMYDLVFAYEDGDTSGSGAQMDAAQAVRSIMRSLFTFRGSFFWRMQSGMGDIVFAPIYEVLKRRGVKFEFFHRLEQVCLTEPDAQGRRMVATLEFDVQARTIDDREYQPLIDVDGLPCWPAEPRYEQIVGGGEERRAGRDYESFWDRHRIDEKQLVAGVDFDAVVLGVGLGVIPHVCAVLVDSDPRWQAMVQNVKTVATQAFQIWLDTHVRDLGWPSEGATVSGFVEPFDTWADMTHLVKEEQWQQPPKSIAYFCSVLPEADLAELDDRDRSIREAQRDIVRRNAVRFLDRDVGALWPLAKTEDGHFDWQRLVDPRDRTELRGEERFDSQFWTANANPSDRYTSSLPGTARYRISPLDYTYRNLTIAGDWTDCGFNSGCVEAAVMSGLLAAHAISGSPDLDSIIGYDHP